MEEITKQILISIFANYVTKIPLINLFKKAFQKKPKLENDLKAAKTSVDFERVFQETIGVIDAVAGSGVIEVDRSSLDALRNIRFDHQNGKVVIASSTLSAPLLQTGGSGQGQTDIVDSTLTSQGTKITIPCKAKITIKGDAQLKQN
ncbi:MAG: hypothetical protein K1060chlam4_00192 [Candidatus Anoxychlamydiales bacterium]|nr:hypothetical protein [Candidatus Anoxychlamydiales bacterium]